MRLKLNSVCSKSKFILDVRGAELLSHLPQFAFQSQFISFSIQTKLNSLNLFYGEMDLKASFFYIKQSNNCPSFKNHHLIFILRERNTKCDIRLAEERTKKE